MEKKIIRLISQYVKISRKLKKALKYSGGDIKEHIGIAYAKEYIPSLKEVNNSNNPGYDAEDASGNRVEIKTRTSRTNKTYKNTLPGWKNKKNKFEYAILISLDSDFQPDFIVKVDNKTLLSNLNNCYSFSVSPKLLKKVTKQQVSFFQINEDIDISDMAKEKKLIQNK